MYRWVQNNDKMCATVVVVGYKWVWVDHLERHINYNRQFIELYTVQVLYNGFQLIIKYIVTNQYSTIGKEKHCNA